MSVGVFVLNQDEFQSSYFVNKIGTKNVALPQSLAVKLADSDFDAVNGDDARLAGFETKRIGEDSVFFSWIVSALGESTINLIENALSANDPTNVSIDCVDRPPPLDVIHLNALGFLLGVEGCAILKASRVLRYTAR